MKTLFPPRFGLLLVACAVLVMSTAYGPCAEPPEHTSELDELSTEQLRVFLRGFDGDWRGDSPRSKGEPPPAIEKGWPDDATLVDLVKPGDIDLGKMPLAETVNRRRSRRAYTDASLTNEELSFLLWNTQGISRIATNEEGNVTHHFRTVPSGGGSHPFETYLAINRVEGMEPGIYRFLASAHKLLLIRGETRLPKLLRRACYGQTFVGDAAVVFIWAAVPRRTEWRYGYIAHRMIAIEAGHVCQNLYLACESIGAGTTAMLGYSQKKMDALIGVDGKDEFVIYVAPAGKVSDK
jgi:SagB-type dehydrogenase family enzyme